MRYSFPLLFCYAWNLPSGFQPWNSLQFGVLEPSPSLLSKSFQINKNKIITSHHTKKNMMIPQVVSDYWTAKLHDLPDDGLQTVSGDEIAFALLKWLEELIGCDESEERSAMMGLSVEPKMGVFRNTVEKNVLLRKSQGSFNYQFWEDQRMHIYGHIWVICP